MHIAMDNLLFPEAYALSKDKLQLIQKLMHVGILHSSMDCVCGATMSLVKRTREGDGHCWQCPHSKCKKRVSIRRDSFFAKHKLDLGTLFMIIFCLLKFPKMLSKDIAEICGVSKQAMVDWGRYIREAVSHYFLVNPVVLGRGEHSVQIDESLFGGRRKYNRGDHHKHFKSWVFGMIEEGTGRNVLWMVKRRDKRTLHNLVQQHIANGATIKSDKWAAYGGLGRKGFRHLTVNHSISFVSEEGIHTQLIESCWSQVKASLKLKRGTRKDDLAGYLDLYSFAIEARNNGKSALQFFLSEVIQAGHFY